MKRLISLLLICFLAFSLTGCSRGENETVFDKILASPVAKLELPDGSSTIVSDEINSLRTFASLNLCASTLEPADGEDDWIYRIVFNPAEMVQDTDEIVISIHSTYVQIDSEYYTPTVGVDYDGILEWAESKFDYFIG